MIKHANKKNLITFLVIFSIGRSLALAQTHDTLQLINLVENNLMSPKQFKDSTLKRYNINDRLKIYKVPSVSIAVIRDGKIDWAKAYGMADVESKKPAKISTQYQAASMGKSVNALIVMKLVEGGQLSLYTDIREYLKSWKIPENKYSKGRKITLIHLLSHTAGFSVHGFVGYQPGTQIPTSNQILDGKKPANNKAIKPIANPGEKFIYSGGGSMAVLGKIISDNISTNYDSLAQVSVFQPLGMTNSTYAENVYGPLWPYVASGYRGTKKVQGNSFIYPAPAGLWTTPTDLAKFLFATIKSYNAEKNCFLNDTLAKRMLTTPPNAGKNALGYGIVENGTDKYVMHAGHNEGFKSVYACDVTGANGVVIMTNGEEGKFINELLNSVLFVYKWKNISSYAKIE